MTNTHFFFLKNATYTHFTFFCKSRTNALLALFLTLGMATSFAQPINDDCSGAISLNVTVEREYQLYSNQLATNTVSAGSPACGMYQGADVWFELTVPLTGKLRIDAKTNVNPKVSIAVYTNACNNLTEYACSEVGASGGVSSRLDINDLGMGGQTIKIRVYRYNSTVGGEFRISAYENFMIAVNDDPGTAVILSNPKGTFDKQTFSTESSTGTAGLSLPNCGTYLGKDVWFTTSVPSSGKLIVETDPGTITPVVVIYTGTTTLLTEYACSLNGLTDAGGEVIIDDAALAGDEIFIRVFANNIASGGTFEIVVLEPRQDLCTDAIELTDISTAPTYYSYTNQYASPANDGTEPTCGTFIDKDIWFKIKVPSNGELVIDSKVDGGSGVIPVLTAYEDPCGSMLVSYACDFWGSDNPFGAKITISDMSIANQYIYLRMYGYNESDGGVFQLATIQPALLPVELISFRAEVANNEVVILEWQTASEIDNDYFLVEHSVDGIDFTPVGHVDGKGTSEELQTYLFHHDEPFFGENYYRLKQVDYDGSFEYSRLVTAVISMKETKVIVYPNPAYIKDGITVRWIGDFGRENLQLTITNAMGKQVYGQSLNVRDLNQSHIDFTGLHLNAGLYYLTVSDKNSLITHQKFHLIRD